MLIFFSICTFILAKLLLLPEITKRINDNHLIVANEGIPILLQTIKVPKQLHYLSKKLPKANYNPLKVQKLEKSVFI